VPALRSFSEGVGPGQLRQGYDDSGT